MEKGGLEETAKFNYIDMKKIEMEGGHSMQRHHQVQRLGDGAETGRDGQRLRGVNPSLDRA